MSGSTDSAYIRHVIYRTFIPTIASGGARTISLYSLAGTYTPGAGLAISALAASHTPIDYFGSATWPVSDCRNAVIGSGQWKFDVNAAAAFAFSANWNSTGIPGGWIQTSNGQCCSGYTVSGPLVDTVGGAASAQLYDKVYVELWQTSPNSGVLGHVEIMPLLCNPWKVQASPQPSLYWGDRTLKDGATVLRTWTQDFSVGPSQVNLSGTTSYFIGPNGTNGSCTGTTTFTITSGTFTTYNVNNYLYISAGGTGPGLTPGAYQITGFTDTNDIILATSPGTGTGATWRIGGGFITNPGTVQSGEPVVWTQGGGATLPAGVNAGQLYFCMSLNGAGTFSGLSLSTNPAGDIPSNHQFVTIASVGSGTNTMTRTCSVPHLQGVFLPADDTGRPFMLPATNAVLYPNLSSAQKRYWMMAGMVPPFALTSLGTPPSDYWAYAGAACGPGYRPNSMGLEPTNIGGGGIHPGIGYWADWGCAWWQTQGTAVYDQLRATALSAIHMPNCCTLNVGTGYIPAFDDGTDNAGASYPGLGAPVPLDYNWEGFAGYQGFTLPEGPSFPLSAGDLSDWYQGIGANASSGTDHWPAFGHNIMFMFTGEPWMLDVAYQDANFGELQQLAGAFRGEGDRLMNPIAGYNIYAKEVYSGERPRTGAWALRGVIECATLGADSRPEKAYFWNLWRLAIRQFYLFTADYETNANFSTLGILESNTGYDLMFMDSYWGMVIGVGCGKMRQDESSVIAGATYQYMLNYANRLNIQLQNNWVSNFWAPVERVSDWSVGQAGLSGSPASPWATITTSGIYSGPLSVDTNSTVINAGGTITMAGYNSSIEIYSNGDSVLPYDPATQTLLGTTAPVFIINLNTTAGTFQVATSYPSVTPIIPTGTGAVHFAIRPQANPAPPAAYNGQGTAPTGYQAEIIFALTCGQAAGSTEPGLAAALAAAQARYNPASGDFGTPPWMIFLADPTITVS